VASNPWKASSKNSSSSSFSSSSRSLGRNDSLELELDVEAREGDDGAYDEADELDGDDESSDTCPLRARAMASDESGDTPP